MSLLSYPYPLMGIIALLFLIAHFWVQRKQDASNGNRKRGLLYTAIVWGLGAVWDWSVWTFSPEANIRIDLLLLIPILLVVSSIGIWSVFKK